MKKLKLIFTIITLSIFFTECSKGDSNDNIIDTNLDIPTISYKSSNECSGRVEILYDLLGLKISNTLKSTKKIGGNYKNFNFKSIQDFIKNTHLL